MQWLKLKINHIRHKTGGIRVTNTSIKVGIQLAIQIDNDDNQKILLVYSESHIIILLCKNVVFNEV